MNVVSLNTHFPSLSRFDLRSKPERPFSAVFFARRYVAHSYSGASLRPCFLPYVFSFALLFLTVFVFCARPEGPEFFFDSPRAVSLQNIGIFYSSIFLTYSSCFAFLKPFFRLLRHDFAYFRSFFLLVRIPFMIFAISR